MNKIGRRLRGRLYCRLKVICCFVPFLKRAPRRPEDDNSCQHLHSHNSWWYWKKCVYKLSRTPAVHKSRNPINYSNLWASEPFLHIETSKSTSTILGKLSNFRNNDMYITLRLDVCSRVLIQFLEMTIITWVVNHKSGEQSKLLVGIKPSTSILNHQFYFLLRIYQVKISYKLLFNPVVTNTFLTNFPRQTTY
jgi:hypothetical protein